MPPVTARDSVKGAFYALGHDYKSETEHFCDNFKGIRENSEIRNTEKENLNLVCPAKCHPLQLETPKGRVYAPRVDKVINSFDDNLKESEKTPKYRNYMKRENLNLVCPAKCHPLQSETPERARCTPLGHSYKSETEHFYDNFKGIRKTPKYRNYMKRENLNLVCPAKCHPLQLETPERARFTPLGHSYKSETEHFYDNFKGIRENSEIPKLHEKGKPKSCMSCQMPPVTARDSGKARFTPLGHSYKSETEHFCDNFKGIRENSEIPKLHEKGKPKSCMSCQMPPVTARDSGKGAFYAPRCGLESV
ncbi:hypothetical protein Fcan01_28572 [Folsomia candida]|uniref:Uncharacterized protein n=1 Tax=Folsomia candida TaxID=158441 RepID=A0A226CT72_FOLCA|nr:hypothetical protein Fcan01_28572 [Folsomia candida]